MEQQVAKKKPSIVVIILVLAVLGVIIYAVTQNKSQSAPTGGKDFGNQIEITENNLMKQWIRVDGDIKYRLMFEMGNSFIFNSTTGDKIMPDESTIRTSYSISEGVISVNYTWDLEEYSEKYKIALYEKNLVLTTFEDSGTRLAGTYSIEGEEGSDTENGSEMKSGSNTDNGSTTSVALNSNNNSSVSENSSASYNTAESKISENNSLKQNTSTSEKDWKSSYLSYINKNSNSSGNRYAIAYIDNNDIPELFVSEDGLDKVCTLYDGEVTEMVLPEMYGDSSYEPKTGKFKQSGYRGSENAKLFFLNSGRFTTLHTASVDEYSNYYIDGKLMDYTKYNSTVNSWLDPAQTSSFNLMDYADIVNYLS